MNGTLERVAFQRGGRVLRFERRLNHSLEDVWAALTQPDKLAVWFARTDSKFTKGDRFALQFDNSGIVVHATVVQVKRPHLLEYTWDDQDEPDQIPEALKRATGNGTCGQDLRQARIRYELQAQEGTTLLTLTHTFPSTRSRAKQAGKEQGREVDKAVVLASWQNHLDGLTEGLGRKFTGARKEEWAWNRWQDLNAKYQKMVGG